MSSFHRECSSACVVVVEKLKQQKKADKDHKARKAEFYINDLKTRREAAVYWFNRFIRLRDAGNGCTSCGNANPSIKYDAGHYVPAGRCSALRFNEYNVNLQCSVVCNQHMSGNRSAYRIGLIAKYGQEVVDFLDGEHATIKTTVAWYQSIEDTYKQKCKELEK